MEHYNRLTVIRDIIAIVLLGIAAFAVQFPSPHRTMVIEGDITLSYPAGNTVPFDSLVVVNPRTLPWLVLFYAIPIVILVLISLYREKRFNWAVRLLFVFQL